MKDKSYELVPGIRVIDAKDYSVNSPKRLDCTGFKQFDRSLNGATIPVQGFIDSLARHYPFNGMICKSWLDDSTHEFVYVKLAGQAGTATVRISFAEAAEKMGWKSLKIKRDGMLETVIPVK